MAVAKEATTVGARKAFRVKLLADGIQTILPKNKNNIKTN